MTKKQVIYDKNSPIRLDVFMSQILTDFTRSYIKKLIDDGHILTNGKKQKAGFALKQGMVVDYVIPEIQPLLAKAENIDLNIIYEDKDILVINKQCGLVVHPCSTTKSGTLVNALLNHISDLSGINGVLRPGIVHRLDKETSGLMVVAKNDNAHKELSLQLKNRTMHREYYALVKPVVKSDFEIEGYLKRNVKNRKQMALNANADGKLSKTFFKVLQVFKKGYTLLNCTLFTGRTHQIRAHLKSRNITIVGDALYGTKDKINAQGMLLHAYSLSFVHPATQKTMNFKTEMPYRFADFIKKIS